MADTNTLTQDLKAQLLKEALEIIRNTKEGVIQGLQYVYAQIPDIIKQFLNWELAVGIMLAIFGIILSLLGIYSFKRLFKALKKGDIEFGVYDDKPMLWTIGNIILIITGSSFFCANIFKIVNIIVAPKIFLIKYILENINNSHNLLK